MLVCIRSKAVFILDAQFFERYDGYIETRAVSADAEDVGACLVCLRLSDGSRWRVLLHAVSRVTQ